MAKKTCDRKKERGRVRHTRAIEYDRSKRPNVAPPTKRIGQRLRVFPPHLFLNVLIHIVPILQVRWRQRRRSLSPVLAWTKERYMEVLSVDGSTLDVLPASYMVPLYLQRWRTEDALKIAKCLLGLAYFWTGSQRGVQLQMWATWILFMILVDFTDDIAAVLDRPLASLSIEMVYRGLYHFDQAYLRGEAHDPITYLAENARSLGLIKRRRRRPAYLFPSLTNRSGP